MRRPIAVVLTDTHKNKNNLDLVYSIFEQAVELAVDLGVKDIIHGGDFFTNRIGQNLQTLIYMKKILDLVKYNRLRLHAIPGNHDKTDQDSEESYLDIFSNHPAMILHRNYACEDIGGLNVSFLGYFEDSYSERLSSLKKESKLKSKSKKKVLITHIAFNGVRNNDGTEVENGFTSKSVRWWDKVLVGHYHDSSKIGDNIFYIGSAYQSNFGENSEDKGFTILYNDASLDFEPSIFPKYIKVEIDADDEDSIENELEIHKDSKHNVRFVFKGKITDLESVKNKISKFTDNGIDCKFESEEINDEILNVKDNFRQLDNKEIRRQFLKYCKIQGIPKEKVSFGLNIIK